MTAYEKALEMDRVARRVINGIRLARGQKPDGSYDSNNDKARIMIWQGFNRKAPELLNSDWTPAKLYLEMSHGYFGSSSGYNDMCEEIAYYMMKAMQCLIPAIADKAIELVKKELESAKTAAKKEAESVLQEVI
jgi:hypothetical protein